MVSFRRVVLAMSLLALFVGLAGAQINGGGGSTGGALTCGAQVSVPPVLRSEGLTEQIGDIIIQCTGGTITTPAGGAVPTANFTVSLGTNVTSRILSDGASEALLFIDDPGNPAVAGPGAAFPPVICSSVTQGAGVGGCPLFLGQATAPGNGTTTAACAVVTGGICTGGPTNVFQGIVNGNQVTFNGVPILAPVSAGLVRQFRITNVRANVNGLGGGGLPGTSQLLANVAISALAVSNPVQIAGFIQSGLSTAVRASNNANTNANSRLFLQCATTGTTGSAGPAPGALLEFKENFATAFKTRIAANATNNGGGIGTSSFFFQGVPGVSYQSESGLVFATPNGTAGLADFGTRLKAVFSNVPTGVRVFVTTTNLSGSANGPSNGPTVNAATTVANGAVAPPVAVMVPSETGTNFAGLTPPGSAFGTNTSFMSEVVIVGGSGTAVWEVIQANPNLSETFQFGVNYIVTGNQLAGTPVAGNSQVNLSYAPTSTVTTASSSASIPRFADTSTASTVLTVNLCQTDLLFPFVTNINGFDTGLAIANTTTDPFGTSAQAGTCTLNFFGSGAPSPVTTGSVATGTVYANTASTVSPGFQGYMIAVCNFQYAHGFAFVSDVGARNFAMGYLAIVLPDPGTSGRPAQPGGCIGVSGCNTGGEQDAH